MSEFDTKQPRIPGYVAMNPDGSFTAVQSVGGGAYATGSGSVAIGGNGGRGYGAGGGGGKQVSGFTVGAGGSGFRPEDAELSIAGVAIKSPPQNLLRYCGDQPGDDWVKRVERLNGIIDSYRREILKLTEFAEQLNARLERVVTRVDK